MAETWGNNSENWGCSGKKTMSGNFSGWAGGKALDFVCVCLHFACFCFALILKQRSKWIRLAP